MHHSQYIQYIHYSHYIHYIHNIHNIHNMHIPSTTKCLRSPLGITPRVLEWGSRAILDLWPSPIVDLWKFWFLECFVVCCNVPPPISHPELGKLFLQHTHVPGRKFPMRKVWLISLGGSPVLSWDACLGLEPELLLDFHVDFFAWFCWSRRWFPCNLAHLP